MDAAFLELLWSIQEKGRNEYTLEVRVCQGHPENKTGEHKNSYAALGTPESGMCVWVKLVSHFGIGVHFHKERRSRITSWQIFKVWKINKCGMIQCDENNQGY